MYWILCPVHVYVTFKTYINMLCLRLFKAVWVTYINKTLDGVINPPPKKCTFIHVGYTFEYFLISQRFWGELAPFFICRFNLLLFTEIIHPSLSISYSLIHLQTQRYLQVIDRIRLKNVVKGILGFDLKPNMLSVMTCLTQKVNTSRGGVKCWTQ